MIFIQTISFSKNTGSGQNNNNVWWKGGGQIVEIILKCSLQTLFYEGKFFWARNPKSDS